LRTILVVDESKVIRGLVQAIVESAGHSVVQAGNCDAGYRLAQRGPVDAIILDCMGHGEGISLLKRLRAEVATAPTPVVALCGISQAATDLAQWADAVVIKPFRPAELMQKLKGVLGDKLSLPSPEAFEYVPLFS
jgi:DNA-binding response OmpR family regulator